MKKIQIKTVNKRIAISAFVGDKEVYCLHKHPNENWHITLSTMPNGENAKDILETSLKCYEFADWVDKNPDNFWLMNGDYNI